MFKLGDKVTWTSQAKGHSKTKVGIVGEVVDRRTYPNRTLWPHLYRNAGIGLCRDHVSYVVVVDNKPYWPIAKKLVYLNETAGTIYHIIPRKYIGREQFEEARTVYEFVSTRNPSDFIIVKSDQRGDRVVTFNSYEKDEFILRCAKA